MSAPSGADSLGSATDFYTYDLAAAAAAPSSYPWYDAATGRAKVYLHPDRVSEYRGPARGYQLLAAGTITVTTASTTTRSAAHDAKEGADVQFTEIVSATAQVKVFW